MNYLAIRPFLESKQSPIVDVRTSTEFDQGHIPGAINIPLFSHEERHQIGILYKEQGKNIAVRKGLSYVGPKLNELITKLDSVTKSPLIHVYCWRGGMRSSSMAWLFETAGYTVNVLTGGYKSYRQLQNELFDRYTLVLLGGETGSGKTKILVQLKALGEQTIDLEALANHKGSAFGAIGMTEQPSTEQFQNTVISEFLELDPTRTVYVEDESSSIGKVGLATALWKKMKQSKILQISLPLEVRVANLVADYGFYSKADLESCILKIQKKLGGLATDESIKALHQNRMDVVARKMLAYYDKSYRFLLERNTKNILHVFSFEKFDAQAIAKSILNYSLV